jgi:hypothetical protein
MLKPSMDSSLSEPPDYVPGDTVVGAGTNFAVVCSSIKTSVLI